MATLTIGGKPRTITFDMDQIFEAEDNIGLPIRPLITRNRGLTGNQMVMLLWSACRREQKDLTLADTRKWVRDHLAAGGSLLEIENPIVDALVDCGIILPKVVEPRPTEVSAANGTPSSP
jgi:hypothetical protein